MTGNYPGMPPHPPSDSVTGQHYYEVELTPVERDNLLKLLRQGHQLPHILRLIQAVELAREYDMALPQDRYYRWSELEGEAARQGCTVSDIIWDRAKGGEED